MSQILHKKERKKHQSKPSQTSKQVSFFPETQEFRIKDSHSNLRIIRLNDICERLDRLRLKSSLPLRSLTGQDAEDYRTLVRYVSDLYDTDVYSLFYDEVRKRFKDLPTPEPGTIGAYFGGCLAPSNHGLKCMEPACSVICAGSLQPLRDFSPEEHLFPILSGSEDKTNSILPPNLFCQYTLVWAIYDNTLLDGGYQFTRIHECTNSDHIIVFLDVKTLPGKSFTGFTDSEKEQLKRLGAKKVNLISYSSDFQVYKELLGGFVSLEEVPSRVEEIRNENLRESGTLHGFRILLLLFLVLIAIFLGWRILKSKTS
jgi:hypothetical protein